MSTKKNLEYAMDRKDREIRELQEKIIDLEEEQAVRESEIVMAEIILFLVGMVLGALLMKGMMP